jgi:hypothetical protein
LLVSGVELRILASYSDMASSEKITTHLTDTSGDISPEIRGFEIGKGATSA